MNMTLHAVLKAGPGAPVAGPRRRGVAAAIALGICAASAGVPSGAAAQANGNGYLVLCPGSGSTGTSYGYYGSQNQLSCGLVDYSFALGNHSNANGTGAGASITALVQGYKDGRLLLQGDHGITLQGMTSFSATANFNGNRITGLARGTGLTDAVNLQQLNEAMAGVADNPRVKAAGSRAAVASGTQAIAIGDGAQAGAGTVPGAQSNIAIGADARTSGGGGQIALGTGASVSGAQTGAALAIGRNAAATATGIALGDSARVSATNAAALGPAASASHASSVALGALSSTDRANSVSIGSAVVKRQLTHLAAGTAETDAVNLGQLEDAADSVATALGGGAAMAAGGSVSAPRYTLEGSAFDNVGDALANLDGRTTLNRSDLIDLGRRVDGIAQGDLGLVTFDASRGSVDVAAGTGGGQVDISGSDGARRLTGVANGSEDADVATIAQLKAAGALDPTSGTLLSVLTYDDPTLDTATLGGTHGTVIDNLADARLVAGSRQAVNGGQLFQALTDTAGLLGGGARVGAQGGLLAPDYVIQGSTYHSVGDALSALDGSVTALTGRMGGRSERPAAAGTGAAAATRVPTPGSSSAPADGTMLGAGAVASGAAATAIGEGAIARADNAVALGQGSVADRAGTVAVGRAGSERQIAHVAEGTEATDAVNKAQLDRGLAAANAHADRRVQGLSDSLEAFKGDVDQRLRGMDRRLDRQGAMSSAMVHMATSAAGVGSDNRVGVGVGLQGGQSALSLGYQRAFGARATLTFGGALSGDEASLGFGAGFGW